MTAAPSAPARVTHATRDLRGVGLVLLAGGFMSLVGITVLGGGIVLAAIVGHALSGLGCRRSARCDA